ncbi:MAG: response regulator [Anaerolineae bacterium]|nr:MAG: response regulator [Anaerolineae bacterium]
MAKILIVDDDPDFVETTRIVLEKAGHTVLAAGNGEAGFVRAREEKPDLIVLDVIMDSVLDGVSLSQRMYDDPTMRSIPIIMVTSIANTDYAELFPSDDYIPVQAFLTKPVAPATLLKHVQKLLAC